MVKRHTTVDFKFACMTEDPSGIHEDVIIIPLPCNLQGWRCKLPYVSRRFLKGTILYMDPDV